MINEKIKDKIKDFLNNGTVWDHKQIELEHPIFGSVNCTYIYDALSCIVCKYTIIRAYNCVYERYA